MLPAVLGLNPSARDTSREISQPCRLSRFCHTPSLADAKLSASRVRSCARVSLGVNGDWAREGTTATAIATRRPSAPERHAGRRANMYAIIPSIRMIVMIFTVILQSRQAFILRGEDQDEAYPPPNQPSENARSALLLV